LGDLLIAWGGWYGLVLGEDIAWREQYTKVWKFSSEKKDIQEVDIAYTWLLSEQAIVLLHWFVNEWYTTYKNSLGLWLHDIDDIVKRAPKRQPKKKKKINSLLLNFSLVSSSTQQLVIESEEVHWQQLIVFPDVWSLIQCVPNELQQRKDMCILHGKSSKKQKSDAFWWIKTGSIAVLICTYSQLFQDRHDLKYITLVDAHTWYYKHYQDPRYAVWTVIERMKQLYDAKLIKIWNTLTLSDTI
jgi:primosomal protein N'